MATHERMQMREGWKEAGRDEARTLHALPQARTFPQRRRRRRAAAARLSGNPAAAGAPAAPPAVVHDGAGHQGGQHLVEGLGMVVDSRLFM
jgi:hypothetical protein